MNLFARALHCVWSAPWGTMFLRSGTGPNISKTLLVRESLPRGQELVQRTQGGGVARESRARTKGLLVMAAASPAVQDGETSSGVTVESDLDQRYGTIPVARRKDGLGEWVCRVPGSSPSSSGRGADHSIPRCLDTCAQTGNLRPRHTPSFHHTMLQSF